ncbi:GNAT family N-acetyltransferase [Paenibacillus sp. N1-5-1-14]|uniref:GNAT family N-acetyltransferase n=1 Tax=Paenibacillus radicibacter TaxID=2972488 RepID=UPI002158A998|nr:GNAT family protein [Paenibacillus radicibacter]MCR8641266.1 GNAT family N-acetyltransferase [Paenibacillus radicibacter]
MNQRIILSPATLEDVDFLVDIKTSISLWPYEDLLSIDKDAVRKNVVDRINSDWYKQYIVKLDTPERTPIGELHIHWYVEERRSWEMGYCIFPEYRGQGYGVEAAREVLKYAFDEWNAHKVVAMCNAHNTASYKLLEKLGLVREGVFREELLWDGRWVNQLFYCILDSEYRSMNSEEK